MQKETTYLLIACVIGITILGVGGEYFTYKYYSVASAQNVQNVTVTPVDLSKNQLPLGSFENEITSFSFSNPMAVGTVNPVDHSIIIMVPPDTDVTQLIPTIGISKDATISPKSNVAQDFMNPVTYTVTAQNGATQQYVVTVHIVSITQTIQHLITSFTLPAFKPAVVGTIIEDNHTVTLVVPDDTDVKKLTPTIKVSESAMVFPDSGSAQNFTKPVIYTVVDLYGLTQEYTVTVVTESNSG